MTNLRIKTIIILVCCIFIPLMGYSEKITGSACYRFSDNESIKAARDIALSMAKRDALEKHSVFVHTTSTVENYALKNDLITSLSAAMLKNMIVLDTQEDLGKREICYSISADIEAVELKKQIVSKIGAFERKTRNMPTGLPENSYLKVLKVSVIDSSYGPLLKVVAECKQKHSYGEAYSTADHRLYGRVIHFDEDGIPESMRKNYVVCHYCPIFLKAIR